MTGPTSHKELRIALPYTPRDHQRDAHKRRCSHRWTVLVWHRRAGKTVFAIMELILAALAFKREDGRFAYICPLLKQAKDVAWGYLKRFTRDIDGIKVNESELSVTFPNGAVIRLYGADNYEGLRGIYLDGVVLDEVAQMKRLVWGEILRPLLADRKGWALFIGTPKGVNLFSELFFEGQKDPEWHCDLRTWRDTNAIDREEVEAARKTMSEQAFAQEFECDFFSAVENTLNPLERVQAAMARDFKPEAFAFAGKVIGVDVARFGDDTSTIARRQGCVAYKLIQIRGLDTMKLAARVAQVCVEWDADAVFVDVTGGLGAGVADRLRQLGHPAFDVEFAGSPDVPRYRNKRCEMWANMAEWLKTGSLPDDQELQQDLVAPTYHFDVSDRMCLEAKDDIKERIGRSPDKADALACTFFAPVAPREPGALRGRGRATTAQRAATEYDINGNRGDGERAATHYDIYRS